MCENNSVSIMKLSLIFTHPTPFSVQLAQSPPKKPYLAFLLGNIYYLVHNIQYRDIVIYLFRCKYNRGTKISCVKILEFLAYTCTRISILGLRITRLRTWELFFTLHYYFVFQPINVGSCRPFSQSCLACDVIRLLLCLGQIGPRQDSLKCSQYGTLLY